MSLMWAATYLLAACFRVVDGAIPVDGSVEVGLEGIVAVVNSDRFRSTWETNKPLHFSRGGKGGRFKPLAFDTIQDVLKKRVDVKTGKVEDSQMKIVRRVDCSNFGKEKPVLDAVSRTVDMNTAETAFSLASFAFKAGFSLVSSNIERYVPAVSTVVKALEDQFLGGVYANWYVTPVGGCAFAPHNDMEDNFIVQLEGQKLWRVYNHSATTQIDLINYGKYNVPAEQMVLDKVALEVLMRPGDVLFVPRGMYHEASVASGNTLSSHITYAASCSIYWGMLFQYLITSAGARTTKSEIELRGELNKPLYRYSEATWLALLVTAVEQATASNVDLRRRIAIDSLKTINDNEQGKSYVKHLINLMKLSVRHVYGDFYTQPGVNGTSFVDEELVKRFENGTGVFDKERHDRDVAYGEGLLSQILTGADLYSAVQHIEEAQKSKLLANKREVTPIVDFLRCGEVKSCESCSATGCSWCISRKKCASPRDTCGTDANAVGIMGGHTNCSATKPFTSEENGVETTSRTSLAEEICTAQTGCDACVGSGCAYDFQARKCILVGSGQPVVGSGGIYKTCKAFYEFIKETEAEQKHTKECPKHEECGACIKGHCAWCVGTSSCVAEGSMTCATARDEVSRFDGLRKECPVDKLAVADAPADLVADVVADAEHEVVAEEDNSLPEKVKNDEGEGDSVTEGKAEQEKDDSWAGAAAAALGLGENKEL